MTKLPNIENRIIEDFDKREKKIFSQFATFSKHGKRRHEEFDHNIRPSFSRDGDRILHSFAFTRYLDKTQVFYLSENDYVSHRIIHVQLLSKIGRIIARALKLNEDLVEAIALGHDIGHTPFGHDGESYLSKQITEKIKNGGFYFHHSVQSVRCLDVLEGRDYLNNGQRSLNLTLQVMDGILCHDGEDLRQHIKPNRHKTWNDFDNEVLKKRNSRKIELLPMTLEGCLVRFVDVISYIGRDMEDAIAIGLFKREDYPDVLGRTNREIVNTLAMDIIENSLGKNKISYSKDKFDNLRLLYKFNMENIYLNPLIKAQKDKVKDLFIRLNKMILKQLKNKDTSSPIFTDHIDIIDRNDTNKSYYRNTSPEIIVVDYIAGMTDDYFINILNEMLFPKKLPFDFRQVEKITGLPKNRLLKLLHRQDNIEKA